jgi:hypothetical protein
MRDGGMTERKTGAELQRHVADLLQQSQLLRKAAQELLQTADDIGRKAETLQNELKRDRPK